MSIRVTHIIDAIDTFAPFKTAEHWDNVGLLVGNKDAVVHKILIALDVTTEVVSEAIEGAFDLILVHHPLIFTGIKTISTSDRIGNLLLQLIQNKIAVVAAHTNLDKSVEEGINRHLGNLYDLKEIHPLSETHEFGIIGTLERPVTLEEFILLTKSVFNIESVKTANFCQMIQTVAISSGASSDFIEDALENKADVFVTADLKYHEAQRVLGTTLLLVDVGHFESEFVYLNRFKELLETILNPDKQLVTLQVTRTEKPIFKYL